MRAGFGLGRIHHLFSTGDRTRLIEAALEAGFTHFDTAPAYGDGLSERELGRVLGSRRAGVTITTKFGIPGGAIGTLPGPIFLGLRAAGKVIRRPFGARYDRRDFSPAALTAGLDASLRRLNTDYVDFLLVHEPQTLDAYRDLTSGGAWAELQRQQQRGKVRAWGVSGEAPLLLEADRAGFIPPAAARMLSMHDASCALPRAWFDGKEVFVFGIVKHLRRSQPSAEGRMDARAIVQAFARAFPGARPIFATNNADEAGRLGAAVRAISSSAPPTPAPPHPAAPAHGAS